MRQRPFFRGLAVLGAFVLSGCYTYLPVASAPPGSEVRVLLPVESRRAGGVVTRESLAVEGTLVTWGDSILVATESTQQVGNFRQVSFQDTLRVGSAEVDAVQLREFSRGRTLGFTAVVVGGVLLIAAGITQTLGGGDGGDGDGNGGTQASITVSRLLHLLKGLGGGD